MGTLSQEAKDQMMTSAKARWEKVKEKSARKGVKLPYKTPETPADAEAIEETSPRERAELNAQHATSSIQMVRTATVMPSSTNPRKNFDAGAMKELAESIRAHGIIQPPLVRPIECGRWIIDEGVLHGKKPSVFFHVLDRTLIKDQRYIGPDPVRYATRAEAESVLPRFELVCGERRLRAAKECGLETIPVIERKMSDKDVLEVQVIENLQRADLHPMEEAEGYEKLMQSHGYTAEDIAAKVGKDKSYVYKRMKLLALGEAGRKAFYDERLTASTALLIARIPESLQAKAITAITEGYRGPLSFQEASEVIQRSYMLELSEAPFDTKSASLVPSAGPCAACPKRTGNQVELFSDVEDGDVCTDPLCFAAKKQATARMVLDTAKESGAKVLPPAESKKLFSYGGSLNYNAPYIDLNSKCPEDKKRRTWKAILSKFDPPFVVATDGDGMAHELILKKDAVATAKLAGISMIDHSDLSRHDPDSKAKAKAEKAEAKLQAAATLGAVAAARLRVLAALCPPDEFLKPEAWELVFAGAAELASRGETLKSFAAANGIVADNWRLLEGVMAWAKIQTSEKLAQATVELLVCTRVQDYSGWTDAWLNACKAADVDLGALVEEEKSRLGTTTAKKGKAKAA